MHKGITTEGGRIVVMESMKKRRTIRKFTDEKLTEDEIRSLLLAAMYSPSAWGKRSWEFLVVDDDSLKQELSRTTPYSAQVAVAPAVVMVIADRNISSNWIEDASIAAEHINLEAVKLGLGSSWIQIRGMIHDAQNAEDYIRGLLDIPENYGICCMIAVGHPAEEKSAHREGEFSPEKVHFNKYGERRMAA